MVLFLSNQFHTFKDVYAPGACNTFLGQEHQNITVEEAMKIIKIHPKSSLGAIIKWWHPEIMIT